MIVGKLTTPKSVTTKLVQGSFTSDHNSLLNRDAADQHPISAITGLDTRLSQQDSQIARQNQKLSETKTTLTALVSESGAALYESLSEVNRELAAEIQAEHDRATTAETKIAADMPEIASLEETKLVLEEIFT